jgi:NADH-quinone oxidoreductase subunit L
MGISVLVAVSGILLATTIVLRKPELAEEFRSDYGFLYDLFLNKWWVDELYEKVVINPLRGLAGIFWQIGDVKGIDGALHGIADGAQRSSGLLSRLQTGFVQNYALSLIIGLVFVLAWAIF